MRSPRVNLRSGATYVPQCTSCDDEGCGFCEPSLSNEERDDRLAFATPGGRSALRAATVDDPRDQPCPTCKQPNRLTRADRRQGYQCDRCADSLEGGGP